MGRADGRRRVRTAVVVVLAALGGGSGPAAAQSERVASSAIERAADGHLVIEGEILQVGPDPRWPPYVEFKVVSVVAGELSRKKVRVWDLPVSERPHFAHGSLAVGSRWLVPLAAGSDAAAPGDFELGGDPIQVARKAGQSGVTLAELKRQIDATCAEKPVVELRRSDGWDTWEVKVYRSGRAVSHYHEAGTPHGPHCIVERQLETAAVSRIEAAIRDARFFELPEDIEPIADADDDFTVTARLGTRVKTVDLTGSLETKTDEVGRLRKVWTAVDRLVPEPPRPVQRRIRPSPR